jgi:hypothetical protein
MATKAQDYKAKLLSQKQFKKVPHQFTKRVFHWMYCSGCGLVNLKNESTRKRMSQPCEAMED